MDSHKEKVFKKWVDSGYKQPATQEELDIVIELQSKGYSPRNAELEQSRKKWQQYYEKNRSAPFPKSIFDGQLIKANETKPETQTVEVNGKTYNVTETKNKGVNEIKRLSELLKEDY